MSNTTTLITNPVVFVSQIPVTDIPGLKFKQAILDITVRCSINGIRVKNPNSNKINVDVSFKILDDFEMANPGTSICGNALDIPQLKNTPIKNMKGKNVTLNFKVNKTDEKEVLEITNEQELYSIVEMVLKAKEIMGINEMLIKECPKYDFTLINTSRGDNREIVLTELANTINSK